MNVIMDGVSVWSPKVNLSNTKFIFYIYLHLIL